MGEVDRLLRHIEAIARQEMPAGLELADVHLAPPDPRFPTPSPLAVILTVVKRNDDPEPQGWSEEIADHVRETWLGEAFQLVVRMREAAGDP